MRSRCWQLLRCSSVMSVIKGQLSSSTTCRRSWPHTLLLRCLIPSSVINSQWDRLWKTHTYMPKWAGYKEWASENKWTCFIIPLQKAINNKHGSNTPTHYLSNTHQRLQPRAVDWELNQCVISHLNGTYTHRTLILVCWLIRINCCKETDTAQQ